MNYRGGTLGHARIAKPKPAPGHQQASFAPPPGHQAAAFTPPTTNQNQQAVNAGGLQGPVNPGYQAIAALQSDPTYLAAIDQGQRQIGLGNAQYTYLTGDPATGTTGRLGQEYGFDATGNIDPNNPYSRAALLQESYKRARTGNTNSYAASGHLYSGALQNAQDESTRQYNIGFDRLQKDYGDARMGALNNLLGTYANASGGAGSGAFTALLNLLKGT